LNAKAFSRQRFLNAVLWLRHFGAVLAFILASLSNDGHRSANDRGIPWTANPN